MVSAASVGGAKPSAPTSTISSCCLTAIISHHGCHPHCPADPTQCVDLSSWGPSYSSQATILDDKIVEVTAQSGRLVVGASRTTSNVAAANVNWHDQFPDVIHMNSILYDGNGGIIFSARHLDAVYRIRHGNRGTHLEAWEDRRSPESLNVVGTSISMPEVTLLRPALCPHRTRWTADRP